MPRSAADLGPGEGGILLKIAGDGPLRRRLLELGFTPGTRLRVARLAPGGDPLEIRLRGYAVTLRRDSAKIILLREETLKCPSASP